MADSIPFYKYPASSALVLPSASAAALSPSYQPTILDYATSAQASGAGQGASLVLAKEVVGDPVLPPKSTYPSPAPSPEEKKAIMVSGPESEPMVLTRAVPTSAPQVNYRPYVNTNPDAFSVDTYRNGGSDPALSKLRASSIDAEIWNKETLSVNGNEDDAKSHGSISLRIPQGTAGYKKGKTIINAYSRFFLQAVSESEQEKYQVVETFTGYYAFFFGKRPPIYRYSGLLISDENYRWNNDFKFVYENFFRGTAATELQAEVLINYDGRLVTGFPLSLTMQQEALNDKSIPFSMDLLVVSHQTLKYSKDLSTLLGSSLEKLAASKAALNSQIAKMRNLQAGPAILIADNVSTGIMMSEKASLPGLNPTSQPITQLKDRFTT